MNNLIIRTFKEIDFEQINKLWNELDLGGEIRGDNLIIINDTLNHNGAFFVVESNNNIIGSAWITSDYRRLYLHHFGIARNFQNKGIGKKLAIHCLNWAKEQNIQIKLEVHVNNTNAIHLYKSLGFKELGEYDVYIIRKY